MMTKEEALEVNTRRRIYEYILTTPGTHLRGIHRAVRLPFGQVLYHIAYLEKYGLITTKKDGKFSRYFVMNAIGRREKDTIAVLRHEVPRTVSILLLFFKELSHKALMEHVSISPSTLSFHLTKMVHAGVVTREQRGRTSIYRLADEILVMRTLLRYRVSLRSDVVDRFCTAFEKLAEEEGGNHGFPAIEKDRAATLAASVIGIQKSSPSTSPTPRSQQSSTSF